MKVGNLLLLSVSLIFTPTNSCGAATPTIEEFKSLSKLNYICQTREEDLLKHTEAAIKKLKNNPEAIEAVMQIIELCGWTKTDDEFLESQFRWAKEQLPIPGFQAFYWGAISYGIAFLLGGLSHYFYPLAVNRCNGCGQATGVQNGNSWAMFFSLRLHNFADGYMGKIDDALGHVFMADFMQSNHFLRLFIKAIGAIGLISAVAEIKWRKDPSYIALFPKSLCNLDAWNNGPFEKIKFATTHSHAIDAFYEAIDPKGVFDSQLEACRGKPLPKLDAPEAKDTHEGSPVKSDKTDL